MFDFIPVKFKGKYSAFKGVSKPSTASFGCESNVEKQTCDFKKIKNQI